MSGLAEKLQQAARLEEPAAERDCGVESCGEGYCFGCELQEGRHCERCSVSGAHAAGER